MPGWRAEIIGAAVHMAKTPETTYVKLLEATAEPASIAMMGYRDHPNVMAAMARAAIYVDTRDLAALAAAISALGQESPTPGRAG